MITLTKKYRITWDLLSLNIDQNPDIDYTGSVTMITDPGETLGYFESDIYQDILDEIEIKGLNIPGEHIDHN